MYIEREKDIVLLKCDLCPEAVYEWKRGYKDKRTNGFGFILCPQCSYKMNEDYVERKRREREKDYDEKACNHCATIFYTVKSSPKRFCSIRCGVIFRSKNPSIKRGI